MRRGCFRWLMLAVLVLGVTSAGGRTLDVTPTVPS